MMPLAFARRKSIEEQGRGDAWFPIGVNRTTAGRI